MNAIEISAIGIIVCTVVNFIFFILALFLTLTVQNWKNDISKDMKILALDKKTEAEAEHWISIKERLPTEKELEAKAESYDSDLCCICRECDEGETNPCQHKIDAMHGYKDGLRHDLWHYPSKGELPKVGEWILCKLVDESRDPYIVAMTDAIGGDIFLVGWETEGDNGFENIKAWQYLPEPPKGHREFIPKKAEKQHISFDEWKSANASEMEELADCFMAHDSEGYFTGDKYNEAYRKIEELCRMAYERR